jgi:hypothetical protein
MKNNNAELLRKLHPEPGSADVSIVDFLYVDRARVSTLYAQLFSEGILTNVTTTSQTTSTSDKNLGTDIKVVKADLKRSTAGLEGIEHTFDAYWSVPLDVLDELKGRALVLPSLQGAVLGSLVLCEGMLRVIDYPSMQEIWEPTMQLGLASHAEPTPNFGAALPHILAILKKLPNALHAHILTTEAYLWSTLRATNLTISPEDITLKYGGEVISGSWQFLFVLDAYPDLPSRPGPPGWSAGETSDGVRTMMAGIKQQIGRPATWYGVTPLMIYRSIGRERQD